jgi:hypothetical protein
MYVMAGLVPAIHVFLCRRARKQDVDARDKRGHDDGQADSISAEIAANLAIRMPLHAGRAIYISVAHVATYPIRDVSNRHPPP